MSETPSTTDTDATVPTDQPATSPEETAVDETTPVDGGAEDTAGLPAESEVPAAPADEPTVAEPSAAEDVAPAEPAVAAPVEQEAAAEVAIEPVAAEPVVAEEPQDAAAAAPEVPADGPSLVAIDGESADAVAQAHEAAAAEAPPADVSVAGLVADESVTLGSEPATAAQIVSTPAAVEQSSKDAQAESIVPTPTAPAAPVDAPAAAPVVDAPAAAEAPASAPAAPAPEAPAAPAPSPAAVKPGRVKAPAPKPVDVPLDPKDLAEASRFGRVGEDGTVYVTEEAGERAVGQFPDASADEAMSFYVRRYLDLVAQVRLFESRIPHLAGRDLDQTLASLKEQVSEPQAVGDLDGLRRRVELAEERAVARRAEISAEREAARAESLQRREEIVSAAEAIAERDPARTQWKVSGEDLHALLEQWKDAQRQGPRVDKATEDALWKRFSKARTLFDRNRRAFFAERDSEYGAAKAAKEALIERAEALSSSTDWGPTAGAYRDLMNEWRQAGRARRKDDDALWERFRAAQQKFFDAREAVNREIDTEYSANLVVKEKILVEAEALLPVTDAKEARNVLRGLQDRWDEAGRVPRADLARVEARMRAVEKAIRDVEDAEWRRSNPETQARVSSATSQLEAAIAALKKDLEAAEAKGDQKKIAAAKEALAAREAWLEQILASE